MFQTKLADKIKIKIFCPINCFENLAVYELNWGKFCTAGLAIDDDMAHAHCMLIPKATNTHSE